MLKTYFVGLSFLLIVTDVRCGPDYEFNFEARGWLKLHSTPAAWQDAFLRCYHDGAVLASPLNKKLADALQSQLKKLGANVHIFLGTHDLLSKGDYVSVEGVPLSAMEIRWGSRADTGDCLTMSGDGSAHYSSCDEPLPFVCYRKLDNQTMNECGTLDNEYHLNQQTGSCYKIHYFKRTWTNAYSICASEGGHLVILNDAEEARIVLDMFPDQTNYQDEWAGIHVGLVPWGKERIWTTIQGEKLEDVYNKWNPGEPNNSIDSQDRGLCLWSGNLVDTDKDFNKRMFACEKSPKSKRFEDLPPCMEKLMRLCNVCDDNELPTANRI